MPADLIARLRQTPATGEASRAMGEASDRIEADARLLWGVVHNIKGERGKPRWSAVREAVGCGSGVAAELCRRFAADPDATWEGRRGWVPDMGGRP